MYTPINVYALLENVYRRAHFGGTDKAAQQQHIRRVAELFAGFSAVAVCFACSVIIAASPEGGMAEVPVVVVLVVVLVAALVVAMLVVVVVVVLVADCSAPAIVSTASKSLSSSPSSPPSQASQPEHSWFPRALSAAEIEGASPSNRLLAVPYRKNIVARDEVNQAACVLVMSWAEAERRGVPRDRMVFLVGSGEVRCAFLCACVCARECVCGGTASCDGAFGGARCQVMTMVMARVIMCGVVPCRPPAFQFTCRARNRKCRCADTSATRSTCARRTTRPSALLASPALAPEASSVSAGKRRAAGVVCARVRLRVSGTCSTCRC